MQPETRYARLGRDRIAYQVLGEGPPDLVMAPGSLSHLDTAWENPGIALFIRSLATFARVILFDRRGTGGSDPLPADPLPPWEAYAEELAVILDEVGAERAALLAEFDAGPTALFFAATQPERTAALILANTAAKFVAADDYPAGLPAEAAETVLAQVVQFWGTDATVAMLFPSRAGDARFRRWYAKFQRTGASPSVATAFLRAMMEVDVRPILPLIQAPTLVLHRRNLQLIPIEHGRYLADHIPGAMLVELPGADGALMWETPELALDQIERFVVGARPTARPNRVLATVLFTDIVGSTAQASRLGDRRWGELLEVHHELAARLVAEFNGQLVTTTGDGILALFDGPARGIRCAAAFRDELQGIGLHIRAGLHIGEVEQAGGDVRGIAVHVAARVMATAQPDEIRTSRTVRDLVVGSDIALGDRGTHALKGMKGRWQLFTVVSC
jgi:class 3 adenylate cyclase